MSNAKVPTLAGSLMSVETPPSIARSFRDLSEAEIADIEEAFVLPRVGWVGSFGWEELLHSQRILMVSEAGAGKTYECQAQQRKLWNAGEPAFFLDLATLGGSTVREMLSQDEENRFDAWLRSQSDVATFFLDSIDELRLILGKFDQALKRLSKALAGQLGRTRIVITTRPVPIDRALIERHLPIPVSTTATATAEAFADMVMEKGKKERTQKGSRKAWRNVGLMPLSTTQIREFAVQQGVLDPDVLLADIQQRDAEEFAERPQDLIELCSAWREYRRIRSHREQVDSNIATKLKPSTERKERAELSQEMATEGASRLALAALLTRKLTLRYGADSDSIHATSAALDVSRILENWGAEARGTLLERPLFGFASYGRVRFHHRSVVEYLAALRLAALFSRGVSIKAIKRVLFTETAQRIRIVRPSMRPVAAWLSLSLDTIFDDIVAIEPAVVLDYGDPQALRPAQRIRALEAYVERYGPGGWRGLRTPHIQVRRFASKELTDCVKRLWNKGIENQEVRGLILQLIGVGRLADCADIVYAVATDKGRTSDERSVAIEALLQLEDPRLEGLSLSIESDFALWPEAMASRTVVELFPGYMPVARLSTIVRRVREAPRTIGDLNYRLPRKIETATLAPQYLDQLRQALVDLITDGITWERDEFPHLRTRRTDLIPALFTACLRQVREGVSSEQLAQASLLAIRLSDDEHSSKEGMAELRHAIASLPGDQREIAFWKEDAFLQSLHQPKGAWEQLYELSHHGGIKFNVDSDLTWVRRSLSDPKVPIFQREMMLWAEMVLLLHDGNNRRDFLEGLKPLVSDAPSLTTIIESQIKPADRDAELRRMEEENASLTREAKRKTAMAHASWVTFWREIAEDPEAVFTVDRAQNTAWDLWRAVERSGQESRASGWSRRFIEQQFGSAVADKLRETMMAAWRRDKPTLGSERPVGQKNTFLVRWQFGLAGIAAEAEDPHWARRLTNEQADLACRYAPLELNGFPSWLESLAVEHPTSIDRILGKELSISLSELTDGKSYSIQLQNVYHAPPIVAGLFISRIRAWLTQLVPVGVTAGDSQFGHNLSQAVEILIERGNDDDRRFIEMTVHERLIDGIEIPFATIWLRALLALDASAGVATLEVGLRACEISTMGTGVHVFAKLFNPHGGQNGVDLTNPAFSPPLLLRLLRLAYQHVRIEDDARHQGSYSPDVRDDAERGRSHVLSALLAATGPLAWAVKLEMTYDPLFKDIKDRIHALARETASEEADNGALTEAEYSILDKTGESPPSTRDAMFALMRDRLDDIDDLLLQDVSPRELWASIGEERLMRREIARVLRERGNRSYTIDQEAVTADEKETDIRFRSTSSSQQGAIELKLGDDRPGTDLFNSIRDQLLTKYMAADDCRAGCLVVTIAKNRRWDHPKTGVRIGFEELMAVLNEEAQRLSDELGGAVKLMARGLDLRLRLESKK